MYYWQHTETADHWQLPIRGTITPLDSAFFEFAGWSLSGNACAPTNVTIVRVSYRLVEVAKPEPFFTNCLLGGFVGDHSESRDR